ncbi:MAG: hypothetical protein QOK44_4018 [Betaproteobacteria bacterium]|jgi:hypothetical protein|nr:hypothetical protein [Betaproteobacteria bacterium]
MASALEFDASLREVPRSDSVEYHASAARVAMAVYVVHRHGEGLRIVGRR